MKTIAFVCALAITLIIYSSGAFVPVTQGITNTDTVSGLVVLSDTDLAQRVGGNGWEGRRKKVLNRQPLVDCGSGNCTLSKEECELVEGKTSRKAKYKCVECPTSLWAKFIYKYERIRTPKNVFSDCKWNFETETCDQTTTKKGPSWHSCDKPLEWCKKRR